MRIKLFTVLTVIASFFGVVSQSQAQTPQTQTSQAQTPETANPQREDYTLTGDSLLGVDNKRSLEDYTTFFGVNSPDKPTLNNAEMKKAPMVLRLDPSTTTNLYLLPNNQPIQFQGDNEKLQLQLGSPQ
jgi:hypothetical protein